MRIQWDGHTHSEFCPHGSKNKTIAMVERAIQLDFTHYSITEHAPLPPDLLSKKTTSQDSSMKWEDLESYWKVIQELKTAYKGKIEILIGLEIDYLLGYENFTQEFLESNQSKLEIILSLLFYQIIKIFLNFGNSFHSFLRLFSGLISLLYFSIRAK